MKRDPLLSVIERRDGDGNIFRYQYDACGRLVRSVDPRGQATAFSYDAAGRLIAATCPSGESVRLGHAFGGHRDRSLMRTAARSRLCMTGTVPVQETDQTRGHGIGNAGPPWQDQRDYHGKGHQISCQYDAEGHLTEKQLDGKTVATYRYDPPETPS